MTMKPGRKIDRIVVTLDGSKLAEVALPYAEEIAAKMGKDIVLLSIRETEETSEYEKRLKYLMKKEEITKHNASKYLNNGKREIEVKGVTRSGEPAASITEFVRGGIFPLIIMASHGRSGISRWAAGSIADKIVKTNSKQPVMLIRAKKSHSDVREKRILKKVLITLDGSERSEAIIPYMAQIGTKLDMELTLLKIIPKVNKEEISESESYLDGICRQLQEDRITTDYQVRVGKAADTIIDFADEFAYDLVAMSTRGMNRSVSIGSVAQKVFLGGNTPLLLVKN